MAADPHRNALSERDIEQAITVLKKGSHLLKYGRRGKPKFSAFRLSNDESALLWYSGKREKHIKLSNVSRIIPGQRTATFQRYPRPEKDYQSFSLILNDRTLDLICKDKEEADVWFVALKKLISRNHKHRSDPDSPHGLDLGNAQGIQAQLENISDNRLGKALADIISYTAAPKSYSQAEAVSNSLNSTSVASTDNSTARSSTGEANRVSSSSYKSSSSQGSNHEDFDGLGDVFIWGEGIGGGMLGGGIHKVDLLPKAVVSTVLLDVHNIACGSKHAVLVTKQGEIFSWGEGAGGRLGYGLESNVSQPKLIDTLSGLNVELVACGEHHTCAVTLSGDLYTWGDGIHNVGLLGHGSETSHWLPKRVCGDFDGIQVSFIACGSWHTAAVTSHGQLFTFGDGSFGALGHGDRSSARIPREVEALKGQRTTRVACGVWHTAAVIEETEDSLGSVPADNTSWGKLFTWGDGVKGRLGHGDQEPRLFPEPVEKLYDQNIWQVACGNEITVALTTFGRVYTMGSPAYGQLGYPVVKGEAPTRVLGKLADCFVEEIACGSYHVAIRTVKSEVYTWGRGGNGQLGHGDNNDKNTPTLVDFLKDKQVKSVKCGSNFTTVICIHKELSTSDDLVCSACRNPFGFRRKRHNCYNCGLVFCNMCSSKKSQKASLAPTTNKPYRVCDGCFTKLIKGTESKGGNIESRSPVPVSQGQHSLLSSFGSSNQSESSKQDIQGAFPSLRASIFSVVASKKASSALVNTTKISRGTSPISGVTSPMSGATSPFSRSIHRFAGDTLDASKQRNDGLSKETIILRAQVEDLTRKSQKLEAELQRTLKQLKDVSAIAADEAEKCTSAKEVIRFLTAQLKEVTGRVPDALNIDSNERHRTNEVSIEGESNGDSENHILSNGITEQAENHILSNGITEQAENHILSNGNTEQAEEAELKPQTERAELKPQPEGAEWVLHNQPGVYITLITLPDGSNELKRIRFSRRHFTEEQAERWWTEHGPIVFQQHNIRT